MSSITLAEGTRVRQESLIAEGRPAGLMAQIKEDWRAHGKDWTKPGFRAVAVHRFGVWRMQFRSRLVRWPLSVLYHHFYRSIRNKYGIELPYTVKLGRRVVIEHQSCIVIHGDSVIGDDCIIRQGVTLGNRYPDRLLYDAPKLGKRVNIGAGAKILGGVKIGDDASIGANAVILEDIPAGATAVGVTARILSKRVSYDSYDSQLPPSVLPGNSSNDSD